LSTATAVEIPMPRLSDSMEEGTVLTWIKQVGDAVAVGEEIAEIETDKANMAFESDVAGTLLEIVVDEGETAAVGATIALIGDPGAEAPKPQAPAPEPEAAAPAPSANGGRVKASPLARRIARERGIDLVGLTGSGPSGRIVKADVEAAGPPTPTRQEGVGGAAAGAGAPTAPETAKGAVETVELSKLQQVVARRMSESKATAPDFALSRELEMDAAVELRGRLKDWSGEGDVVPSYNDLVVKACALALQEHPRANGAYKDGRWELYERVNIGIAVAAADGALIVPVVNDADKISLGQIARESRRLAGAAREGKVTPPELAGGTFTVSNLGMFGVDNFTAVINPPQAAILAVGALAQKPVVVDGELAVGWRMGVTLVCDHRILSGADGAVFLARVAELLSSPGALVL